MYMILCYTLNSIKSEVLKMQQVTSLQEIETFINQNGEMVIGKNSKMYC